MDSKQIESAKRRAAISAVDKIEDGMTVGLGTGTTTAYAIKELGERIRQENLDVYGVPTSSRSKDLAVREKIPLTTLECGRPDIAIDGADQFDKNLNLIKGGGAAHTREKIIASTAKKFIVIVDHTKKSKTLDLPIPIETIDIAIPQLKRQIQKLGGDLSPRNTDKKDGHIISDNGNPVLDADLGEIKNPKEIAIQLSNMPGIIEHGLFLDIVDEIHLGKKEKTKIIK